MGKNVAVAPEPARRVGRANAGRALLAVLAVAAPARAAEAPKPHADRPALTVRLVKPGAQVGQLIGLCRGSRAADPAAALAAWKHATGGKASLGKPLEAALAALNPEMAREFRGLDGARLVLGFETDPGGPCWNVAVPRDDGSLAALATAVALTDGACEAPIGNLPVLRLGPPGAPLAVAHGGRLVLGSDRDELRRALDRPAPPADAPAQAPGLHARLDPAGLRGASSLNVRRVSAWLDAAGTRAADARLALADETLTLDVTTRRDPAPVPPALDPAWLDVVPASGVLAAAALAADTSGRGLEEAFAVLDRVERADPARANVAPLRTRLNLLAAAARVRLEADVWPDLRGVTAALLVDDAGRTAGAIVALHTASDDAATRLARDVLPRLAASFARDREVPAEPPGDESSLGRVEGRPLSRATRGRVVLVGWGDAALTRALAAHDRPAHSAGPALRGLLPSPAPQRFGALWVGRHRAAGPPDSPLARALAGAPPVVWHGRTEAESTHDGVRWTRLRGVVRRWLDALPLDPPPHGSATP